MRKWLMGTAAALLLLTAVLAVNVLRLPSASPAPARVTLPGIAAAPAAQRLAGALRIRTISFEDPKRINYASFDALAAYFARQFPRVHRTLKRERVNRYSLLYTWPGTDPKVKPILLLAHLDVVPIEPGTEARWQQPPFGGVIKDGVIWGRGALDDKASVVGWLEAVEVLLARGFKPVRTVYFAFGHDEEIGGTGGAKVIAEVLRRRGVRAEFLLDEGGLLMHGMYAGVARPVASLMLAEKGYATFHLTARAKAGHSSVPPPHTAVGTLARAVARLQANPLPQRLAPPVTDMLDRLAPEMDGLNRVLIANRWLTEPLLLRRFAKKQATNAMTRTTTAPTMFNAGVKENILPSEARAVVNFRLLPGDTMAELTEHIRETIDDETIEFVQSSHFGGEASPVSEINAPAYRLIERTAGEVFPEAVVAPGLVLGATDARHYLGVYENRYNCLPLPVTPEDISRFHGMDERIEVADYARLLQFYIRLLENAAGS